MEDKLVSAKVAYNKNHLRPLIMFLIEERLSTTGDADFVFSLVKYRNFLNREYKYGYTQPEMANVKSNLELLKHFVCRDKELKIISPESMLLSFSKKDDSHFTIKKSRTEYLTNILRYIEKSIFLKSNGVRDFSQTTDDEATDSSTTDDETIDSFFGLDQKHFITFFKEPLHKVSLGKKEEAIFNYLRAHFNEYCSYSDLFDAVLVYKQNDPVIKKMLDKNKAGYIRDAIDQIRAKLFKVSGFRSSIETASGRTSSFKLVY